ncbi:MAG: nucleotidyltransferase family protein [Proteobacteria bacterium]|nr:nucleotidyltransferase family protein [Pseudomonadota bacterium]MBU4470648.1 nucleotidyltransferase family protein [Pseudomonadota bacterium]MCG2753373.1 nucleotidyltransferase family protein [Desulfobacteraceae bacterium]
MTSPRFSAILLAAGYSSRMGSFKPLLFLGKNTIIEGVIALFRASGIDDIRVVVGHNKEALLPVLKHQAVTPVENPDFHQGMFSSVQAGVSRLAPDTDAFFIMPGDMPLVQPATIQYLMAQYEETPNRIIRPLYQGKKGHPPLIPFSMAETILNDRGDGGLREILNHHRDRASEIEVQDPNILLDMDRPQDFNLMVNSFRDQHAK